MKRVLIATDAWRPQINGVVRSLETLIAEMEAKGYEVKVVSPSDFRSVPSYYAIASSRPLEQIVNGKTAAIYELGLDRWAALSPYDVINRV